MLSYTELGKGTPVVFLHGLGSNSKAWIPQHELSDKYRLIAVDLRGHGSTEINYNLTVKNFASDIIKLLEHLDIQSAVICGLSLGGIVAQEVYKQRPDMVLGLILANTCSYVPPILAYGIVKESERHIRDGTLIDHVLDRGLHNQAYREEARNAFLIRDTYLESANAATGLNYFPLLHKIRVPTLLIGSTNDKVTPVINTYTMRMFIKNVRSVILSDTGHLSNIEQSEKFNQSIREFMEIFG
ncbi:beta-ketoadipate enol-lactone hydrolase [Peribacillus asahii]|uniref:Beta-ketoadipate enol-lactone hydrolase n=1 Tax=Peribacillus asahii TaxID=228899 RepID=A0A3Q9RP80_9BACI|nr:alpha/beta hydrolase [Peribacillus asahii]AZV43608.1 beta-ketoadipate enol-lactone hydrolase [Peribacillus asahii]